MITRNDFIAIITCNDKESEIILCNHIRVIQDGGTEIHGILEGSSKGYDTVIAFIPKHKQVILKANPHW